MKGQFLRMMDGLLAENRMVELIQQSLALLKEKPEAILPRYYLGLARILRGEGSEGMQEWLRILQQRHGEILAGEDLNRIRFLGTLSLQLAQVAEYHLCRYDLSLIRLLELGANLAVKAGDRLQDAALQREGATLLAGILSAEGLESGKRRLYPRPSSPPVLQLEPTNRCNLACPMCTRTVMTREEGFLNPALMETILGTWEGRRRELRLDNLFNPDAPRLRLSRSGMIRLFHLGEPMLHPRLGELLEMIRRVGAGVSVQTNGTLLNRPVLRKSLLQMQPSEIGISLDGLDPASYERVRVGSKWKEVSASLEALHRDRAALGLQKEVRIKITALLPDPGAAVLEARIRRFLEPMEAWCDMLETLPLHRQHTPRHIDGDGQLRPYPPEEAAPLAPDLPACLEALYKLTILWDGTVVPCGADINATMPLGSVEQDGGVDAIWRSERTRAHHRALLAHDLPHLPFCFSCLGFVHG